MIQELIDRVYGTSNIMQQIVEDLTSDIDDATTSDSDDLDRLKDLASEAPVVRLVNHLIAEAARRQASDIHIEPYPASLAVRLRIDGILIDIPPPPVRLASAVVSRIKILARLNIAERRLPQDGRIRHIAGSQALDLRVSTLPTVHGESVVIRLLPVNAGIRDLAAIGLPTPLQSVLHHLADAPHGLILVTGPTGSGKTTTVYATLQLINKPERKVLTVEDPVEYQMERVSQVQVRPVIDLTYARILRSMLRQDPDVIMIGEMRDSETATIAIHAALTGHLVLSTLHTNDAPSAITRLIDMNIEPFLLASTIRTVIAQRLVRVLCHHCRQPSKPSEDFLAVLAASDLSISAPEMVYSPQGCEACNGTGYSGRVGIFEMMMMTEHVRRLDDRTRRRERNRAGRKGGRDDYDAGRRAVQSCGRDHDLRGGPAGDGKLKSMPTFVCQSIGPDGALVEGRVVAGTRASAFDQLRSRGHLPVSVAESTTAERPGTSFFRLDRGKIGDKQLLAITKELSLLLGAGQQLEQALSLIVRSAPSARIRRALTENSRAFALRIEFCRHPGEQGPISTVVYRNGSSGRSRWNAGSKP